MDEFLARQSGDASSRVLELSGMLTIHYAGEIKTALMEAFSGAENLTCDLQRISEIDLAGLQLLCAAHRMALGCGISLSVNGLNENAVQPVALEAGFLRHVGCRQDASKTCLWVGGEK